MDDAKLEQKLVEFLTPTEVNVPPQIELDNNQLDCKIAILKEQQDQIMHILKINYWNQLEILIAEHNNGSDAEMDDAAANTTNDATIERVYGLQFLITIKNQTNSNLYYHLSKIYSLRKMTKEYEYIRRNNLEYATV